MFLVERLCGFPVTVRIPWLQVIKNSTNRSTELKWHMTFKYGLIQKLLMLFGVLASFWWYFLYLAVHFDNFIPRLGSLIEVKELQSFISSRRSACGTVQRMRKSFCGWGPRRNPNVHYDGTGCVTCPPENKSLWSRRHRRMECVLL